METRSNHVLVGAVVLILLAVLAIFTVWIARLSGSSEKEYDIFFKQSVDGLNKGSAVAFSGVPSGQVKEIALWKPDPQFVRVRISVNDETPVLQGTTATIQGVGFTGVSQIQLDGAVKGAPPIRCPEVHPEADCPFGVPVIPPKQGGLGALLNSAPKLLERLSTLTERLTEMLSDKNQASISGILANTNRLTGALADRGPEIAATIAETRVAIQKAGDAAQQIGQLADTTNGVMANDVRPAMQNLNKAVASAQHSMETLDSAIGDARPGIQSFSKQTMPEIGQLVRDLRVMSAALTSVAEKIDQGGAGSLVGAPKLPDYKGKKK
ncbi:MCE family protein [Sphingomonas sp. QA11]|jgi:phospholipid/cholesterol/gamma-HCH transport system substrate-binding protein|uniref:ABC-type transport system periplasmic component n=1 Tax=hydrothermal vent metagenome TaxID=652676 RepID=A0A160TJN3_9ZZZZ|nr:MULTISPECIES: MlaD family protein [unclassified Sphingomonas]WCM26758.1 MCE family protein [Sphingomonas sp. QA11]WEJ98709.1 MAG: MlaD family protein [Sphingomonas sp.]